MTGSSYFYKNDDSLPALPFTNVYVLVGQNDEYNCSSVTCVEKKVEEDVQIMLNPKVYPTNASKPTQSIKDCVFESEYPKSIVEYSGIIDVGGFRVLCFHVCPFRYDAGKGNLYFESQISLKIELTETTKRSESKIPTGSFHYKSIKNLVVNGEDMETLYDCRHLRSSLSTNIGDSASYLIITRDSLKAEFQKLADWKTTKGIKAKVMTVEEIYSHYTDRNYPLRIKHAIRDYYLASNGKLEYVLLGGGSDIVPVQKCFGEVSLANDTLPTRVNSASDMFYACLSDLDWDTNSNNRYGEIEDNISVTPDIVVTRFPVSNASQAKAIVAKTKRYEMNPVTEGWKNEILMCAVENEDRDTINGVIYSAFHLLSEKMFNDYIAPTSWSGSKYMFYDTGTSNDNLGDGYDVNATNLQAELSKGYAFVNVYTHGEVNYWRLEGEIYDSYFSEHASSLSSPRYTVITTEACYTNDLTYHSNIGSSFLKNTNSGIIGYYGSSDRGLVGITEKYVGGMYGKLFQGNGFGVSTYEDKMDKIGYCTFYGPWRWNHLFLVPLCDPEMTIYSSIPQKLDGVTINHYNSTFTIHYSGVERFDCCVSSRHDVGRSYYYNMKDCNVFVSLTNLNGEYMACLTLGERIPYRSIIGPTVFLQNEDLSDNLNVTTGYTYIGSQVTDTRDEGPVTVSNGKSIIATRYGATIEGFFEVKPGASLEISTGQPTTE